MFNVLRATKCDTMGQRERMPTNHTPLSEYILELLKNQNMSMREGSMKAGLAPETISQIIRRGKTSTPRPDTLQMLADALGGSYQRMMILAGYLEDQPGFDGLDPELKDVVYQLLDRWDRIAELDPSGDSLRRLLTIVTMQAAAFEAAMKASNRTWESEAGGE
jgi:transcriptional regulator with XRE-family HTH domain